MAVRLDIFANVKGSGQVQSLNRNVNKLGKEAAIAATRMKSLEKAAVKGRASFQALATTLKVGVVAGLAAVTFGVGKFVKDTFAAGNLVESLQIRFKLLFGSVEEGAKAFDTLNKFAAKVPFSLEEIAAASGNLAVISEDADELAKVLELTGNVAAATSLDFRQTAEQIQRAFAGGIAAADVFRERGVRAMLGFEAGVKVSVEETKKRFFEVFGKGGTFGTATDELAKTLKGQVSLVQDAYFQFRKATAETFFPQVTQQIRRLVGDFKENSEQLNRIAIKLGNGLGEAFIIIEKVVRSLHKNFDLLVLAFKSVVALKIASVFVNMSVAIGASVVAIRQATTAMGAFNLITRANPIGALITAVQAGALAWIYFGDSIKKVVLKAFAQLAIGINKIHNRVLEFVNFLNNIPGINIDISESYVQNLKDIEAWQDLIYENELKYQKELEKGNKALIDRANIHANELNANGILENLANKREQGSIITPRTITEEDVEYEKNLLEAAADAREQYALKSVADAAKVNDQIFAVQRGFSKGIKSSVDEALDIMGNYERFGETVFTNLTDEIAKFVQTGKFNFKDMANSFISEIIRMETKALAAKAIQSITNSAGGGGFGGLISAGRTILGFNKGGVVPGGAPYTDRVPAMLTPGEVVIPRDKVNSMGNNRPVINNINISGNVDQRAIDQIRSVIVQSTAEVGSANRAYQQNTNGLKSRNN